MTRSELAVSNLSREQVSEFYKIVREELEKENIIWDVFVSRTYIAPVRRARHYIVWRLRESLKLNKRTIANLVELDEVTVRTILKTMDNTNDALNMVMQIKGRKKKVEKEDE